MAGYTKLEEQVERDFTRARQKAFLRRIRARLREGLACDRLLSSVEVTGSLGAFNKTYLEMRGVPVEKGVNSVNRYRDFDAPFLPTKASLKTRWKRIDHDFRRSEELPPVSIYKIDGKSFVADGSHGVSVARYGGLEDIDAEVTAIRSQRPLGRALERAGKEE